jgi:hypothetical protein
MGRFVGKQPNRIRFHYPTEKRRHSLRRQLIVGACLVAAGCATVALIQWALGG